MADIFISYKREDRPLAERLAAHLTSKCYTVWWDHQLVAGIDYDKAIEQQLAGAACVIVLWTAQSVESRNVKDEAHEALAKNKLLPVVFGSTQQPLGFRMVHAVQVPNADKLTAEDLHEISTNVSALLSQATAPDVHVVPTPPKPPLWRKLALGGAILLAIAIGIYFATKDRDTGGDTGDTPHTFAETTNVHKPVDTPLPGNPDTTSLPKLTAGEQAAARYLDSTGNSMQPALEGDAITSLRVTSATDSSLRLNIGYRCNAAHPMPLLAEVRLWPISGDGVQSAPERTEVNTREGYVQIQLSVARPTATKTSTGILVCMMEPGKTPFAANLFEEKRTWKPRLLRIDTARLRRINPANLRVITN